MGVAIRVARRNNLISDRTTAARRRKAESAELARGIYFNDRARARIDVPLTVAHNFRHSFNQTADHLEKNRRNPRRWEEREHVNLDPYSGHDSEAEAQEILVRHGHAARI